MNRVDAYLRGGPKDGMRVRVDDDTTTVRVPIFGSPQPEGATERTLGFYLLDYTRTHERLEGAVIFECEASQDTAVS